MPCSNYSCCVFTDIPESLIYILTEHRWRIFFLSLFNHRRSLALWKFIRIKKWREIFFWWSWSLKYQIKMNRRWMISKNINILKQELSEGWSNDCSGKSSWSTKLLSELILRTKPNQVNYILLNMQGWNIPVTQ